MGKGFALVLVILLLILISLCFLSIVEVKSQGTPFPTINITINADGSITQPSTYFNQTGNTYTLRSGITGQTYGQITVLRSNAVIDGNGNTVQGELLIGNWGSQPAYQPTAHLSFTSNVTVKNFNIIGASEGVRGFGIELILTSKITVINNTISWAGIGFISPEGKSSAIDVEGGNSNLIVGNNLVNNWLGMVFHETENNQIIANNITNTHNRYYPSLGIPGTGIYFWIASNNTIYHNNFVNNDQQVYDGTSQLSVNSWDNGTVGNYWSDYESKYPNATENDNSGIGNTPYEIDTSNRENYPLIQPYAITSISPSPTSIVPEFQVWTFPLLLALMVAAGLLVYFKKHKPKNS